MKNAKAKQAIQNGLDPVQKSGDRIPHLNLGRSENRQVVGVQRRKMNQWNPDFENQTEMEGGEWAEYYIVSGGE